MDLPQLISPAGGAQGQIIDVNLGFDLNSFNVRPFEFDSFDLATLELPAETNGSLPPKANGIQNLHEARDYLARGELPSSSSYVHSIARPRTKRNRKAPTKKDKDWKPVRGMLTQLYPTEDLDVVMQKIKDKCGFEAT